MAPYAPIPRARAAFVCVCAQPSLGSTHSGRCTRTKTLIQVKRNASSGPEEERRGWGKRRRKKRRNKDGQKGEKGERQRRRTTTKTQEKKAVGAKKKKIYKIGKKKIKLKTNLMDITEAEFPPEVQNMRALE